MLKTWRRSMIFPHMRHFQTQNTPESTWNKIQKCPCEHSLIHAFKIYDVKMCFFSLILSYQYISYQYLIWKFPRIVVCCWLIHALKTNDGKERLHGLFVWFCFFLLLLCVFFNRIFFKLNLIFCILVSKLLFITRINIYISFLPPVYWICIKGAVEVNTPIFGKSEASALLNHFVNVVATKLFWLFFFLHVEALTE